MFLSSWLDALKTSFISTRGARKLAWLRTAIRHRAACIAPNIENLEDRTLLSVDFGDAPDTGSGTGSGNYNTTLADNGPQHTLQPGLYLGAQIDPELDATANSTATGDDTTTSDDDDGVVNPTIDFQVTIGTEPQVTLRVTNTTGTSAALFGWIDFNGNGNFDNATERASVAVPTGTANGLVTLTFPTVPTSFTGTTFARFRLSTDSAAADPTGLANDGEVENYAVTIVAPSNGKVIDNGVSKIADNINGGPPLFDGDTFGFAVASLGDLDGDGITDVAVGTVGDSTYGYYHGAVHILLLNADGSVKSDTKITSGLNGGPTLSDDDLFGISLANMGDLDGDGVVDLAVGAAGDSASVSQGGAVHVLYLNSNGTVKSSLRIASGVNGGPSLSNGDSFGSAMANIGDLDGDGVADLAVGAYGDVLYVLLLNASGTVKASTKIGDGLNGGPSLSGYDGFGFAIANIGDLDGDGVTDLAVGAEYDTTGGYHRGAVHILFMNDDGTVKSTAKIASGTPGAPELEDDVHFGSSVAGVGDMNGDGVKDLAVGSVLSSDGGAIYTLFLNSDGTVKSSQKIGSGSNGGPTLFSTDEFGVSLANLGDFDGNGTADLIVGDWSDTATGFYRGAVYILRLDEPATPSALDLSASTIAENEPTSTAIGTLTTTDDNPFDTFTYTLVSGSGSVNNGSFQISGDQLLTNGVFNFEVKSSYSIRVRTTDDSGRFFDQPFTITITNVNEAPTVVSLQNTTTSLPENTSTASAVQVADIVITDDALGTNTISLSGTDAASFEVVGTALRLKSGTVLKFEIKPSYTVTVNVDDTSVGTNPDATTTFTLTITDVNEAPTAVSLQNTTTSLPENTSTVAAIHVADVVITDDALGTNTISLSGTDAASFEVVGTALRLKSGTTLNFEEKSSYSITVSVDDTSVGSNPDATTSFSLAITNVNEAPVNLTLSATRLTELLPAGTSVGTLSSSDPDGASSVVYTVLNSSSAPFEVQGGNVLVTTGPIDAFDHPTIDVVIRATDGNGAFTDRTFTLTVDQVVRAYRAYNVGIGAHFFTTNRDEFNLSVAAGYRDEATGNPGFAILMTSEASNSGGLHRLYNLATGRHYYTMNQAEANDLVTLKPPPVTGPDTRTNGWRYEGIVGYMFNTQAPGTVEVYRLYNSFSGGHLFTVSAAERDAALSIVDLATATHPWSRNDSLGFAYLSDASHAFRTPHTAPAVAAFEWERSAVVDDPLFETTDFASLAGVMTSSASSMMTSFSTVAENTASEELMPKQLTDLNGPTTEHGDLDHLFSNLHELTNTLT